MTAETLIQELKSSQEFFNRSTRCLAEEDSAFRPAAGMFTAAQQVAHVAQTIEWFVEGAWRPEGFDMNFEKHMAELEAAVSLTKSREALALAYQKAREFFGSRSEAELMRPLPEGPVMGGMPVSWVPGAIVEHTAHHRGALSVYSRLLGKTPPMPYGDM